MQLPCFYRHFRFNSIALNIISEVPSYSVSHLSKYEACFSGAEMAISPEISLLMQPAWWCFTFRVDQTAPMRCTLLWQYGMGIESAKMRVEKVFENDFEKGHERFNCIRRDWARSGIISLPVSLHFFTMEIFAVRPRTVRPAWSRRIATAYRHDSLSSATRIGWISSNQNWDSCIRSHAGHPQTFPDFDNFLCYSHLCTSLLITFSSK